MKKFLIIILLFGLVYPIFFKEVEAKKLTDLEKLLTEIKQVSPYMEMQQWQVVVKEKINQSAYQIYEQYKQRHANLTWDTTKKVATIPTGSKNLAAEVKIIPLSQKSSTVMMQVSSNCFSNEIAELAERIIKRQKIGENPIILTCITGIFGDNIDEALPYISRDWLTQFKANEIEQVVEDHFISVSAKSQFFQQSLSNQINLQMAFREDQFGKIQFTVGTPIILFEY